MGRSSKRSKTGRASKKPIAKKPTATHGGAREGAGRPRDSLPQEVIDRLKAPPSTPNELRTWNAKLLAEVQWLCIKGEIGSELAATLRANAGSIDRALPPPEPAPGDDDYEDQDDEDEDGPELTEGTGGASLRVE